MNSKKRKLADTTLEPTDRLAATNPSKRRELDIGQLIDFLESVRSDKPKKLRQLKPYKLKLRKSYPLDLKAFVIYLRFGTLTNDCPPIRTMEQVRDITGVKLKSCYTIVRIWRSKGFQITDGKVGHGHPHKLTPELEKQLINPKTLTEMAHHSLRSRVLLIEQRFGVKLSARYLCDIYHRNKVRFVKP